MKALSLILLAGLSGCTAPNPKSCADNFCHDPSLPFCDKDGSIGGTPNTCIAVACTPNEFAACRSDEVLRCNSAGNEYDVISCEFGCNELSGGCNPCVPGGADCQPQIIPAHLPDVCNVLAELPAFTVSSSMSLDTSDDSNCTGGIIDQATGPDICVLRHESIVLRSAGTLTVKGNRALALVADHDIALDGVLDISADGVTNGPGGGVAKSGGVGIVPAGSGGAGFKTTGADGGNDTGNGGANNGGPAASMNPALLVELVGGAQSQPYAGSCSFGDKCGYPGGAGGALAVISCRGAVTIPGMIDAGGGGGISGTDIFDSPTPGPGGGGGSGGYIVIQGMSISVTGELYSNGGGGGAGHASGQCELGYFGCGGDGTRSATESARGGLGSQGGGPGGNGGREGAPPSNGWKRTDTTFGTSGGGGGSTGFIQTYTPSVNPPLLTPRGVSPAFEPNLTAQTR